MLVSVSRSYRSSVDRRAPYFLKEHGRVGDKALRADQRDNSERPTLSSACCTTQKARRCERRVFAFHRIQWCIRCRTRSAIAAAFATLIAASSTHRYDSSLRSRPMRRFTRSIAVFFLTQRSRPPWAGGARTHGPTTNNAAAGGGSGAPPSYPVGVANPGSSTSVRPNSPTRWVLRRRAVAASDQSVASDQPSITVRALASWSDY